MSVDDDAFDGFAALTHLGLGLNPLRCDERGELPRVCARDGAQCTACVARRRSDEDDEEQEEGGGGEDADTPAPWTVAAGKATKGKGATLQASVAARARAIRASATKGAAAKRPSLSDLLEQSTPSVVRTARVAMGLRFFRADC